MSNENEYMSEEDKMVEYAKTLLSDCRFQSVAACMAQHYSGDDGYHSVPQLFWGVMRHGDELKKTDEHEQSASHAPIEERLKVIDESLRIIKDCLLVLARSKKYEEAITAHRTLAKAGIDADCLQVLSDNTNRLVNIEDKLDTILECLVVLTAKDFQDELESAQEFLESRGC